MPRAWLEFAKDHFADDRNTIAPVERNCTDVEDTGDGCVGSEPDQVNGNAPEDGDPDGVNRCSGSSVHDRPDTGAWDESIARERKKCTGESLLPRQLEMCVRIFLEEVVALGEISYK